MFDKELNIEIKESPLHSWPGQYFMYVTVDEIIHYWNPHDYNHHFTDKTEDFSTLIKVLHRNVKMKLYQPNMKHFEVTTLQKCLEPLGFMEVSIRDCEMSICDTFSRNEVKEILECFEISDNLSGYVQQASLPTPNTGIGYEFEYGSNTIATKCFNDEFGFSSLGYLVFGGCDLANPSKILEPAPDRLLKKEIVDLIEGTHNLILEDVVKATREISRNYWKDEEKRKQKARQEERKRIKKEMEIQNAIDSFNEGYYGNSDEDYDEINSDEMEELREIYDINLYYYYYDDDYDFEDLDED